MTLQSDDHNTEEGDDHQLIRVLTKCVDTTLTPPRAQSGAILSKPENRYPLRYAAFANLCKPLQRLSDHS
jgi:hypothetical protein